MSYKTWRARDLLGVFFILITQPYVLAIGSICIGLGVLTWQYFDEPIFGFTVRAFITKTLPLWVDSLMVYAAQVAARRPVGRVLYKILTVIALQAAMEWFRNHFEDEIAKWNQLPLWSKVLVFTGVVALLWLAVGWWAFALFPIFAARDVLVSAVRWVIYVFGLQPIIERGERALYMVIPEPVRIAYDRIDIAIHEWAKHHRDVLHNHHHIRAFKRYARERLHKKKQLREAQKRAAYTAHYRERFKSPPFF